VLTNATPTVTELNLLSGQTTLAFQPTNNTLTQWGTVATNAYVSRTNGSARGFTVDNATASRAAAYDANGVLTNAAPTTTELNLLSGQTTLAYQPTNANLTTLAAVGATVPTNWNPLQFSGPALTLSNGFTGTNGQLISATNSPTASNQVAITAIGKAGQNTNIFEVQSSAGALLFAVKSNGCVLLPDGSATFPSLGWFTEDDGTGTGFYRTSGTLNVVVDNNNTAWKFTSGGFGNSVGNMFIEDATGGRFLVKSNGCFAFTKAAAAASGVAGGSSIYQISEANMAMGTGSRSGFSTLTVSNLNVVGSVIVTNVLDLLPLGSTTTNLTAVRFWNSNNAALFVRGTNGTDKAVATWP